MNPAEAELVLTLCCSVGLSLLHITETPQGRSRPGSTLIGAWPLSLWFHMWMQSSISPHDCYMIAALLLVPLPDPQRNLCEGPSRTAQDAGWGFSAMAATKDRGHDKSLFHARHGLIPSPRFTKSVSGIAEARARLWVSRSRCMFVNRFKLLCGISFFSQAIFCLSPSPCGLTSTFPSLWISEHLPVSLKTNWEKLLFHCPIFDSKKYN